MTANRYPVHLSLSFFIWCCFAFNISDAQNVKTLVFQPDSLGKDAIISELGPNTPRGNYDELIASAWTNNGIPFNIRSLIEFDLSSIPNDAMVINATLSLYGYYSTVAPGGHSTDSGPNDCYIRQISQPWDEQTVTWNTQPLTSTINQVVLPASTSLHQDYLNIDVSDLVKAMVSNPSANHGFMLSLLQESHYRRMVFGSGDNPDSTLRPKLVISFLDNTTTEIANVITPNGDFINDVFLLPDLGTEKLKCKIYNRWGIEVYEISRPNQVWDGRTISGKEAAPGIYYYSIAIENQSETKSGFIHLLR